MILWQANLGRGVSEAEFTRNLRAVLDAAGPRAVICFQEIDEADTPDEMDALARLVRRTHTIVGEKTSVPILVPRFIPVVEEFLSLGCKGLAKFTPNRPINEAVLQIGPNLTTAALNGHIPLDREETQERRAEMRQNLRARCKARQEEGHAGVWVLDTNTRRGWPTIAKGEKSVIDAGIDKAKAWAPPCRRVVVSDRRTVRLSIDGHSAHGARLMFEPASS